MHKKPRRTDRVKTHVLKRSINHPDLFGVICFGFRHFNSAYLQDKMPCQTIRAIILAGPRMLITRFRL